MNALGGRGTFAILLFATRDLMAAGRAGGEDVSKQVAVSPGEPADISSELAVAAGDAELADIDGVCAPEAPT